MYSGSEAGSYVRLIDFVYYPTLGLRVIKKKSRGGGVPAARVLTCSPNRSPLIWKSKRETH